MYGGSQPPGMSIHHGGEGRAEFMGWECVAEAAHMWEG